MLQLIARAKNTKALVNFPVGLKQILLLIASSIVCNIVIEERFNFSIFISFHKGKNKQLTSEPERPKKTNLKYSEKNITVRKPETFYPTSFHNSK
jgi:hypothetical protein